MNDFDDEPDAANLVSDRELLVCGLLPREHADRGTTFVRRPEDESEPTKMYRAVAVRVGDDSTTLLVGPKCDISPSQTYLVVDVRGVSSGRMKTVRFCPMK